MRKFTLYFPGSLFSTEPGGYAILKIIIDFDGTLTAEESQAKLLSERSLDTLAEEIIKVPRQQLAQDYAMTQAQLLQTPHAYWWQVNGLVASYCNEGAFILNTTTVQVMLKGNEQYLRAVEMAFPQARYDAVVDCTNYLFHRHTAEFAPAFRPETVDLLNGLIRDADRTPIVLTNSLGDKVKRHLATLPLSQEIAVLGDTRQYEMDPHWNQHFHHASLGDIQVWPYSEQYQIDLRRPDYYRALVSAAADGSQLAVVADTFSMPGAMPLMMNIPFFLLRTSYTPSWCVDIVNSHPYGYLLTDLSELPAILDSIALS